MTKTNIFNKIYIHAHILTMQMPDYIIYLQTPQDNNQNDLVKTEQMTGNT